MKQKKIAMMVAAAMVLSLTGGAKADAAGDTAAREGQITFPLEEKEEINICVQARTLHTTPFDEMPFVKMMEEMTNVHVNWTAYPETSWESGGCLYDMLRDGRQHFYELCCRRFGDCH